ncbi:uncharacterized protein IL334_003132 [Kwoniella shivajii]|uniref:Inositolphosphorylceramide synthase subunit Kei1-domain-containing protein n=1 Tax=Kwoniella shivajii TaxID=564305 RepID=A0ABZ1CXZ2_9TREE|nr:hypothetical protein IL334_003132 [Kwoniella shivajii]
MRLTFRRPGGPGPLFSSFLGLLDIKLGAEIVLLFGLINKVAGLYGLITILVGGSFVQLTYYAYSTGTLFAFLWGLKVVKSESASPTLLLSHLYTLDHILLTIFHYIFYLHYWFVIPHDGRRNANSQAQQDLINLALSRNEITQPASGETSQGLEELRTALAGDIWEREEIFARWTLISGWLLKLYFIVILYSYAGHLKSSTYHTLPLTFRGKATSIAHPTTQEDQEAELARAEEATRASTEASPSSSSAVAGSTGSNGNRNGTKGKGKGKGNDDEDDFSWD